MNKKKVLNVLLLIIVILIVLIFGCGYYIFERTTNSQSVYDEIKEPKIYDIATDEEIMENRGIVLGMDSIPFSGAFPGVDIMPFVFDNRGITEFSNDLKLKLGFSKVTKDDWASSYIAEGEPLSIPASLLDNYIKNIFGEKVEYTKTDFSIKGYSIDKEYETATQTYNVTYNEETDTYIIEHSSGEGVDENYIYLLESSSYKIKDELQIEIPYVFVEVQEHKVTNENGEEEIQGFEYIVYANCDYETKTFSDELGRFSEEDTNEAGEFNSAEMIEHYCKSNLSKINKLQLVYRLNEDETACVLSEIN